MSLNFKNSGKHKSIQFKVILNQKAINPHVIYIYMKKKDISVWLKNFNHLPAMNDGHEYKYFAKAWPISAISNRFFSICAPVIDHRDRIEEDFVLGNHNLSIFESEFDRDSLFTLPAVTQTWRYWENVGLYRRLGDQ